MIPAVTTSCLPPHPPLLKLSVECLFLCFALLSVAEAQPAWTLGPFQRVDSANPCLLPNPAATFVCPIRNKAVAWEEKDVFNPAAVVRAGRICLLYRAQDSIGEPAGTSRIGLAWSEDGLHFTRHPEPVLYPDNDFMKEFEWEGGCEDPRIVEDEHGMYVMTYTAYDGRKARLAVATSRDLLHWEKRGLAFAGMPKYEEMNSKSGAIVTKRTDSRLAAVKINGRYWMYWGDWNMFLATSEDLIHWTPVETATGELVPVLKPRRRAFDSRLVEPGPPAMLTEQGILLVYNSANARMDGDPSLHPGAYAAGQALFAADDPRKLLQRTNEYFFSPENAYETRGQVNNVCFLEGLVYFNDQWFLYYGMADSRVGVALKK